MENNIKVGVGVLLIKENKVLLGHRVKDAKDTGGIYEPDSWTCPGGKQEYNETILACAVRETKEETNLVLEPSSLQVFDATDDIQPAKHFITLNVLATKYSGELKVMEPNKIDEWRWFDLSDLPDNIYTPSRKEIDNYLKGREK